jgi:hypothetical protein
MHRRAKYQRSWTHWLKFSGLGGEKEYKSGSQEISNEYLFAKNRRRHCREQASHSLEVIQVICSFAPLATRPVETEEELPCQ